jgi:cytochrome c
LEKEKTMSLKLFIAGALVLSVAGGAFAADGATLYQERTCTACHGKDGKKPLMPDYPKIAGQNAKYVEKQMLDIKSGARANGNSAAMKGVMEIVSEDDIKALADYVSKLKP